ncbi:hypothetical protein BJY00DRAFT_58963 [Aspergillus carlsbadensis]|nr:hypothetical protein BJY00DRAFT_58963 [Aspergillus carlsbadensis]
MQLRRSDATLSNNAQSSTNTRRRIVTLKLPPRLLGQLIDPHPRATSDRPRTHAVAPSPHSPSNRKSKNTSILKRKSVTGAEFRKRAREARGLSSRGDKRFHRTVLWSSSSGPPLIPASTNAQRPSQTSKSRHHSPNEPGSRLVPLSAPFRSKSRAGLLAEAQDYRELYTPAPDPDKKNIGETLRHFHSNEVDKHTRLLNEIEGLQQQRNAISDRITRLEEQAAKARRNSGRAERYLERPEKLLGLDMSKLYTWMRAMDTPEPQDSSALQSNRENEGADEDSVIVLSD